MYMSPLLDAYVRPVLASGVNIIWCHAQEMEAVLQCVHDRKFLHGDVELRSWTVRDDGSLCLMDWATAKPFSALGEAAEATVEAALEARDAVQNLASFCRSEGLS